MKKLNVPLLTILIFASGLLFNSCKKDKTVVAAPETYKLIGRIDPARTTISGVSLTKAEFTITYNSPNSFGDPQSILNGQLALTGFVSQVDTLTTKTPIANTTPKDTTVNTTFSAATLELFATQPSGPDISYITVSTSKFITYKTSVTPYPTSSGLFGNYSNLYYTFNNSSNATLTVNNLPFTNDVTLLLKDGRGYFRIGRGSKYVFILLDNVTKL